MGNFFFYPDLVSGIRKRGCRRCRSGRSTSLKGTLAAIAIALTSVSASAQTASFPLGYSDGTSTAESQFTSARTSVWINGAVYIPASTVRTFAGNTIKKIRAAIKTRQNIDSLRVWLRSATDGANLAEGFVTTKTTPKIASGWNEVALEKAYDIPADNTTGLYIGYAIHQKAASSGLSVTGEGEPGGLFVLLPGTGQTWTDHSDKGLLGVQAIVEGDRLPKYNMKLLNIITPQYYSIENGKMKVEGTLRNFGTETIKSLDIVVKATNGTEDDSEETTAIDGLDIKPGTTAKFEAETPAGIIAPGDYTLSVGLTKPNGHDDLDMSDNARPSSIQAASRFFTHNVLVEEFTTERCGNCPGMAEIIEDLLKDDTFNSGRIVNLSRHSGFGEDWLTQEWDRAYQWFAGSGEKNPLQPTAAPTLMVDRTSLGGNNPLLDVKYNSIDKQRELWKEFMEIPAFVSIDIKAETDKADPDKLNVKVSGQRSELLCKNPHICLALVENNIRAKQQVNYYNGPSGSDFIHQHVVRAVNSTWGEPIVWEDATWNGYENDKYSYEFAFTIDKSWKRNDMQVAAFIYNYNDSNTKDCKVANAAMISLDSTTGIANPATTTTAGKDVEEYFTPSGIRVPRSGSHKGLYIVRQNGTTKKIVIK